MPKRLIISYKIGDEDFLSHQMALNIPQTNQHPVFVFITYTF